MQNKETDKTMIEHMRDIRDQISLDIMDMSLEERNGYIAKELAELKEIRAKGKVASSM